MVPAAAQGGAARVGRQEEKGGGKRVCSFKSLPGRAQQARLPDDRAVATAAPCRHWKASGGRARGGAGGEERGLCHRLVGAAGLAPSGGPCHLWEAASDWSGPGPGPGPGPSWRLRRPPSPLSSCRSVTGAAATLPRSAGVRAGAGGGDPVLWAAGGEGGRGRLRAPVGGAGGRLPSGEGVLAQPGGVCLWRRREAREGGGGWMAAGGPAWGGAWLRPRFCSAGGRRRPAPSQPGWSPRVRPQCPAWLAGKGKTLPGPGLRGRGRGRSGAALPARQSRVCLRPRGLPLLGSRARAGHRRSACPRQRRGAGTSRSPARAAAGEVAPGRGLGAEQRPAGGECWCSAASRWCAALQRHRGVLPEGNVFLQRSSLLPQQLVGVLAAVKGARTLFFNVFFVSFCLFLWFLPVFVAELVRKTDSSLSQLCVSEE